MRRPQRAWKPPRPLRAPGQHRGLLFPPFGVSRSREGGAPRGPPYRGGAATTTATATLSRPVAAARWRSQTRNRGSKPGAGEKRMSRGGAVRGGEGRRRRAGSSAPELGSAAGGSPGSPAAEGAAAEVSTEGPASASRLGSRLHGAAPVPGSGAAKARLRCGDPRFQPPPPPLLPPQPRRHFASRFPWRGARLGPAFGAAF